MAHSIPNFSEGSWREAILGAAVKRTVLSVSKDKLDDQSMEVMRLKQELEVARQQSEIAHQENDILLETVEKLKDSNLEMTVHNKVVFEATQQEAMALRQQNLQIQMENFTLKQQLEEIKVQNKDLQLSGSKVSGASEEIKRTIEKLQNEIEKLTADHKDIKEKSEIIQKQSKYVRTVTEYYEKKLAHLSSDNDKLQERIVILIDELKEKKIVPELRLEQLIANDFQLLRNSLNSAEEKLKQNIELSAKLESTLSERIVRSKYALEERKERKCRMMGTPNSCKQ